MANGPDVLRARTKQFALDVLRLSEQLPNTDVARHIGRQLVRSATSVGANYRSACRSRSRAEFIARIGVVVEEADESAFWFEILIEHSARDRTTLVTLLDEANQLTAIFTATRATTIRNQGR